MSNKSNPWSIKFGQVKSQDPSSGAVFKFKRKENPYIRGARYRSKKGIDHSKMSNSEAY